MLEVVFTPSTREVRLRATADTYEALARAARDGASELPCDAPVADDALDLRDPDVDAALALPVVAFQATADPLSGVTLRVMSPGLVVRGGAERLELLARDFDQLSKADPGERLLAEWFPGHAYLVAASVPTVFELTARDPA